MALTDTRGAKHTALGTSSDLDDMLRLLPLMEMRLDLFFLLVTDMFETETADRERSSPAKLQDASDSSPSVKPNDLEQTEELEEIEEHILPLRL